MLYRAMFIILMIPIIGLPQIRNSELFFKKVGLNDGLSSYNIKKILQDKYKFTWIATQDGLNRYDGNSMEIYSRNSGTAGRRILGNDITDLVEDTARNILWVATSYGGINAINLSTKNIEFSLTSLQSPGHLQNQWIRCMNICLGKLWIGSNDGLDIYDPRTNSFEKSLEIPFKKSSEVKNFNVDLIYVDTNSMVWVFFANLGLVIYSGKDHSVVGKYDWQTFKLPYVKEYKVFNGLVIMPSNELLVATHNGFIGLSCDDKYNVSITNKLNLNAVFYSENISAIAKDLQNNIWFSTTDKLFKCNKDFSQIKEIVSVGNASQKANLNSIFTIYFDENNSVWIGTVKEMLYSANKPIYFYPVYQSPDYKIRLDHTYFIYPADDSILYVCASDGLYFVDVARKDFRRIDSNKSYFFFYQFNNIYFVTNEQGFYVYSPGNRKLLLPAKLYKELGLLKGELINSIIPIGDSVLLLASETANGIYKWNYRNHTIENYNSVSKRELAGSNIVNTMYRDSTGNVWILGDNQIAIYDPNQGKFKIVKWTNKSGQLLSIYFDMCEAGGFYWLAAYGTGILQVDKNLQVQRVLDIDNGLQNTGVYKIIKASDSVLYISTNKGMYLLNTTQLQCKGYFESDGLHSSAFEGWCGNKRNDFIYLGGDRGFTMINTKQQQLTNTNPPDIFFNHTRIETTSSIGDTSNLEIKKIVIPENYSQVTIFFSGINYSNPERTTFTYKISELQNRWISLDSRNFLNLIGLSPGTYHLQVKAANEDGVWSDPKELILVFLPKWYQTWWFYLLIALTVAAILYALYRYRISQIKKQHEIRKNIATDLHDDLGSTLNSVKVFTNLAISGVKQEESLQQVKDNLTEATMSLRDMIWVLDDSLDTVDELITRLKQFAIPVAAASNIEAIIKADSEVNNRQLIKEEKRNLFLICKEAINNSIKYSGASQVDVSITASGKKIQIVVADNGKGFNVDEVKKGYGLKNMQYRAGQIKYKVALVSSPGNGTQVEIKPV